ncbi:uncharacterized protein LOC106649756 isoform X2 [Trichogramma pretiosum]|uniref:uncharacterized protein LOC106649756 isoform X2 n=1 Tax=Trichogramma pretiosum TaxID=7493 RepID=UPI0006C9CF11|nr:uncharacterized protein LOC106649756 isoform X2 [Trichogramma pretiosum]
MEQTRGRTNGAAPTASPLRRSLSATTTSGATAAKTPEVRCACQYFGSYSLLPERSALLAANKRPPPHLANVKSASTAAAAYANNRRPAAAAGGRTVWQRPAAGNNNRQQQQQQQLTQSRPNGAAMGDNEYEPVGQPVVRLALSSSTVAVRMVAPVVKITDTAVADSDDSIEDRYRFQQRALILDGDVIVPLDGSIEDNAMAGKNLGDQTIDTLGDDEELSSASSSRPPISGAHRQHNFELAAAIKEARQEAETRKQSLIDEAAAANVESPLRRGARDFQQRLKNQAGRIHSRLSSIQKPTFGRRAKTPTMAKPMKPKPKTMTVPPSPRAEQKASRLERFRMALPERPKFHLPDKSKFHLPDKSKFHLPERPKFNLPDRPKFNMPDTTKLRSHLKKPNIQMPKSFNRVRRSASQRVTRTQESVETAAVAAEEGAQQRRSIFDFSTYPRPKIFERKAKAKASGEEFATSSPKESRAQSTESWSTFPRVKKAGQSLVARWSQRFGDTAPQHHFPEPEGSVDRSRPWRHPSLEEPRLSLKPQTSQDDEQMPWETASRKNYDLEEASVPLEEDEDRSYGASLKDPELSYGKAPVRDPGARDIAVQRARSHEERGPADNTKDSSAFHLKSLYDGSFPAVDPRDFGIQHIDDSIEHSEDEESMRSDREIQQSSGSSCERRRRGVIEEIGSDEFFLRAKGISQENMRFQLIDEIRDAIRPRNNATAAVQDSPPKRPQRRKRKEESVESFGESSIGADSKAPQAPKRDHSSLQRSPESFRRRSSIERASSLQATHRVVYQTESTPSKDSDTTRMPSEPALDDLVVIKPQRRKSRTSLRSSSLLPEEQNIMFVSMEGSSAAEELAEQKPSPMAPSRRKRFRTSHQSSSLRSPLAIPEKASLETMPSASSRVMIINYIRTNDSNLCNGYPDNASPHQSVDKIPPTPPPSPPPNGNERNRQSRAIDELDYIERSLEEQPTTRRAAATVAGTPIPPKRTRSRTASMIFEDDRTSHGADSLPGDFDAPVLPRDSSSREPSLPGYARIERKDKPPRAPPPRRKRQQGKFATTPRPSKHEAKRSPKTYSHAAGTLRSARSESMRKSSESIPFMDADYSLEHDDGYYQSDVLRSDEVLNRMHGRPLPAPPRPPRHRKSFRRTSLPREITPDYTETIASTQTDPLGDDLIVEEEVTGKLVMTPSRSGSTQVLISTERVPSPSAGSFKSVSASTPPIPPRPGSGASHARHRPDGTDYDGTDSKSPAPDRSRVFDLSQLDMLRAALFSGDEPLRIPSLEVADLKVDRLTVSQLEAYKVAASEIDAIVVSATEMSSKNEQDGGISASLVQELIAIRNQLEAVAAAQSRPQSVMEDAYTSTSNERIDLSPDLRRSYTRESTPLLVVEPHASEQEATASMGRTVFPQSGSSTDLRSIGIPSESTKKPVIITTPAESPPQSDRDDVGSSTRPAAAGSEDSHSTTHSRSASPGGSSQAGRALRQTASPVRSLPPVISVTPDAVLQQLRSGDGSNAAADCCDDQSNVSDAHHHVTSHGARPQRAVMSYLSGSSRSPSPDPSASASVIIPSSVIPSPPSQPPPRSPSPSVDSSTNTESQYVAFPLPPEFFSLAHSSASNDHLDHQNREHHHLQHHHHHHNHQQQHLHRHGIANGLVDNMSGVEPSVAETSRQLLRALGLTGSRALRQFVDSVVSRFNRQQQQDDDDGFPSEEKVRRVELAICALLVLIAGLILACFCSPRNVVTHHHHWDYFNPPQ